MRVGMVHNQHTGERYPSWMLETGAKVLLSLLPLVFRKWKIIKRLRCCFVTYVKGSNKDTVTTRYDCPYRD